jgi:hypothetical protein
MLHVNDDNNDELFRKAAADYFLRAENPDWDISGIDPSVSEAFTQKKKKNYRLLPSFFSWLHHKKKYNRCAAFFRIFRFNVKPEKTKKKSRILY